MDSQSSFNLYLTKDVEHFQIFIGCLYFFFRELSIKLMSPFIGWMIGIFWCLIVCFADAF